MSSSKKILIVEDSHIVALHLQKTLEMAGYSIAGVADSYESALELARKGRIDLAFMDIMLDGDKDGIETATQLWGKYSIPIVFITALSDPATLQRTKAAHAFAYLTKPFQDRDVLNALELALYKYDSELALHNSREQFYSVVQSISDPLITINEDYKVTYLNPAAESLTGWVISQAIGKYFEEVFQVVDMNTGQPVSSPLYCDVNDKKGHALLDHFLLISKQGREYPVGDGSISPMLNSKSELKGMVIVFKNLGWSYEKLRHEKQLDTEKKLALQRGEENERQRLSRDLHDGLGQLLNYIKIKADTLPGNAEQANEISTLLGSTIKEVSRIADELLPTKLRHFNLGTALKSLCENYADTTAKNIIYEGTTETQPLDQTHKISIYRVAQEALRNAIKHGEPQTVEITFERLNGMLRLSIEDNGVGFEADDIDRKNGLLNMQERAALMGGDLNIQSKKGEGTKINLTIPIYERKEKPVADR
jgi:PAS domain S-box-containing protein